MKTFIDVVGYQLEKVHTGAIKYLLDWENDEISQEHKRRIIQNFLNQQPNSTGFDTNEITSIYCWPEYAPQGRKLKIDLVVDIELRSGHKHYLVLELKVDGEADENQLKRTYEQISLGRANAHYFLLLFGSSSICAHPSPEKRYNFKILTLDEIIPIFSDLIINSPIYKDWIESLNNERLRRDDLIINLNQLEGESIWSVDKKIWLEKGYRPYFPLFYYYYYHLRKYLNDPDAWTIYSGGNNPVMNWEKGWVGAPNDKIEFFWEFNYEALILKARYDQQLVDLTMLNEIRTRLYTLCEKITNIKGNKTINRPSKRGNVSVYRWNFNFKNNNLSWIADMVDNNILKLRPSLSEIQKQLVTRS